MGRYRFGPIGRLMVIDVPDDGFADDPEEYGGIHQTLNGTRTKDVLGRKATIKVRLEGLDPRALSWFEMAYTGALGEPLYFLDEQRLNRLSPAASSARSAWAEDDPFSNLNGARTQVANTSLLLPGVLDGAAVQTPGPTMATTWVSTAAGIVRVGPMIPVQAGEHVVFSLYCPSGTPTLEFTPFLADLSVGSQAPPTTSTVVVAGAPARRYVPYTVPSNIVALQPCIRHAGAQSSTWTGLQFEQGDTPTPWVLGHGVPNVLVDSLPSTRRKIGNNVNADIVLLEA